MPETTPAPDSQEATVHELVLQALDAAYADSARDYAQDLRPDYGLNERMRAALCELSRCSGKAATGFTNIVTSVAIKAAMPHVDVRYHQVQIQHLTTRPAGFNLRGVSEKTIYPWLAAKRFDGAKSGWQTRTFERPKPYILSYDENIGDIKEAFLTIYDELEEQHQPAEAALRYLLWLQIEVREKKNIDLALPSTDDVMLITSFFEQHFFRRYAGKGASRLPVLALHSLYQIMVEELLRFKGMRLAELQPHSAADSQTGSLGDIEVVDTAGVTFEVVEVKHNLEITPAIFQTVREKVMTKKVNRYYVLTTHKNCNPDGFKREITDIQQLFSCQVIVNGVIPSLRYYLRMLSKPSHVFPGYIRLLQRDASVTHEHREAWNNIITSRPE